MAEKKITLAILDDEVHIIRLLEALIPWDELCLEYIGNAHNGIDGRSLIIEKKPDIVITDIKMPGLDGLSLIAEIHESFPNTEFIILSGFSQFDYAKKAITYDVKNYLLKPINKAELRDALEKLIKNKKNRQQEIKILQESGEQKLNSVFENLLLGKIDADESFIPPNSAFHVCLIKIDSPENAISGELYKLVYEKIVQILKKHGFTSGVYINKDTAVFLSLSPDPDGNLFTSRLQQLYFDFQQITQLFPQLLFTFFESGLTKEPLHVVYQNLLSLLPLRRLESFHHIITPAALPPADFPAQALAAWNKNCDKIVSAADDSAAGKALSSFIDSLTPDTAVIREQIYASAARHLAVLVEERRQNDFEWYSAKLVPALRLALPLEELTRRFKELVLDFIAQFFAGQQKDIIRPVRLADAYMQEHFSDYDISLEKVAEIVGLTPAYFSALYKKEKQTGFLESLTAVRIKKSKDLLQSGNETVAKISSLVGYSDIKYFGKIFKKVTGITPNEFRQFYS